MTPNTDTVEALDHIDHDWPVGSPAESTPSPHPDASENGGSLAWLQGFIGLFLVLGVVRSWWIPGLVLGLLFMLFMHELGHYVTARLTGMKVTAFFLGFGPKIWSFHRGETEYGLKAIPAGAYVRIIGMTNLDEVDPANEARTYRAQPWWQRMVVICAGSAMHFAMALVALVVLFGAYAYPGFNGPGWEVAGVVEGSSAADIGIEAGDRIVTFDGESFATWPEFGNIVLATDIGPVEVEVDRGDERLHLSGELGARSGDVVGLGFGIAMTEVDAGSGWVVQSVRPGSSAASVGLAAGDVLVEVEGNRRPTQLELAQQLVADEGGDLDLVVDRGGELVALSGAVTLDRSVPFRGFLGVEYGRVEPSWAESVPLAIDEFGTIARMNIDGLVGLLNPLTYLGGLFEDEAEPSAAAPAPTSAPVSPASEDSDGGGRPVSMIGISRMIAESESADQVLFFFMMVNIFVGLFNLVPLLPLDGGHAAIATYEKGRQVVTRDQSYRVDAARLAPLTWLVVLALVGVGLWAAVLDIFAWPA